MMPRRASQADRDFVERLVQEIADALKEEKRYAIYEEKLSVAFPRADKFRETKIQEFAREHGWRLRHYSDGLCAIFDLDPTIDR